MSDTGTFPDGFLWGAATSAYQIEGAPLADGAGPSIWHRFSHTPGLTRGGDTGDVACDHYHRFGDDVALMEALGLQAYRFSVAWARVLPQGRGRLNPAGLDFYQRLVDALLDAGITPVATLYHWDLPAALDDRGGWLNPDSAQWFAEYAQVMHRALGDRVPMWITLNEPWVVTDCGYLQGVHAPGHRNLFEAPLASINLLRAHGLAVQALRAGGAASVGIAVNLEPRYPASDEPADLEATARAEAYMNRQYLDPLFLGRYPRQMADIFGQAWPEDADERVVLARQPLDFLGINYYTRSVVRSDPDALPLRAAPVRQARVPHTAMDWEIHPRGLCDTLLRVRSRYGDIPLYITENGAAFEDPAPSGGVVEDLPRVRYLEDHLRAVRTAMDEGVDVRGYFAWSLLDNFEWSYGYSKRFGIVHVDFATQRRTPKRSARFYAGVIRSHGAFL